MSIESITTNFGINETTLLYFFSTLAQSYAAITALFFTAGLSRINWLDNDITSRKKAILYCFTGTSHYTVNRVDFEMSKFSASEVAQQGVDRDIDESKDLGLRLFNRLDQMRELRSSLRDMIGFGLSVTIMGILGTLISNAAAVDKYKLGVFLIVMIILLIISVILIALFIHKCLEVSQTRKSH